jgi:hypothetical protein
MKRGTQAQSQAQAQIKPKAVSKMTTFVSITRAQIIRAVELGELKPNYLLTINSDPKTIKGLKYGILTGVLYGTPATGSGAWNDCPFASVGCMMACLNTSGHGGISIDVDGLNTVQIARLIRSAYFHLQREAFWAQLIKEIKALVRKAARLGLKPAARLNGTTDIKWESTPVTQYGVRIASNIFELFEDVQFYDYSKWPYAKRPNSSLPANYHLTFSRSESNGDDITENLAHGRNVTVVFGIFANSSEPMPTMWQGVPVIDGNVSDIRFQDPTGVVVGLKYKDSKGSSRAATKAGRLAEAVDSGFVVGV